VKVDEKAPEQPETLRATARARIVRAAMNVLAERGLRATVDDVAVAAGVSRRTVFRHFPTHDQLFIAAVHAVWEAINAAAAPAEPAAGEVRQWLVGVATTFHEMSQRLIGRAFWDIHIDRPGTSADLADVISDRTKYRRTWGEHIATIAWRAQGGTRTPPAWVVDAFSLQLSGFAFNGMMTDAPKTPAQTGRVSGDIMWAVLTLALQEDDQKSRRRAAATPRRRS
jgi:AcrR family transcriptional regulator